MSMLPFPDAVGVYALTIYPKHFAAPNVPLGSEPCLYADADGNPVWLTPQGMKNGFQKVTTSLHEGSATERKIAVNYAGAVSVLLPLSFPEGEELLIWDAGGNAGVVGQEITITPPSTQQINSLGKGIPLVLNKADIRVSLIRTGSRWNAV